MNVNAEQITCKYGDTHHWMKATYRPFSPWDEGLWVLHMGGCQNITLVVARALMNHTAKYQWAEYQGNKIITKQIIN